MALLVKDGQCWNIQLEPNGLEQDIARLEYGLNVQDGAIRQVATYRDALTVYDAITARIRQLNECEKQKRELPVGPIAKWVQRLEPVLANNPHIRDQD